MKKLRYDLGIQFKKIKHLGEIDYNEDGDYWVITLNKDLNLFDKISVLSHEIIHYLDNKELIACKKGDDEKVAKITDEIMKKGIKIIIKNTL